MQHCGFAPLDCVLLCKSVFELSKVFHTTPMMFKPREMFFMFHARALIMVPYGETLRRVFVRHDL